MTVVFFVAAYLTLGVMIWPYMIPYTLTVANAAAPDASLGFLVLWCSRDPAGDRRSSDRCLQGVPRQDFPARAELTVGLTNTPLMQPVSY